ncbi:rRNA maturation RNase YbeY [Candidatus Kinetoplastidibacterium crithidiae]|uniref:Endoribonuclease YbeY n=1 Tax=Candidatus Kinetoplastidibacterium crithidiae TCC036E TaxID=1208918 RepID=M1LTI3_9PROT|nr:rRNA maturation RNase YbeY [Candidatus Kinetoplastibacterium crithidii]AFZ83135.1 putative rRNA maturation factor [Candidatus Kinetoplastibacterium crithidii (ex Angomonas deanei ATCC 30255)]AGF47411.1 metalloprotease [Candidatus Kinetoplastibacterium crithidii TCC036E]
MRKANLNPTAKLSLSIQYATQNCEIPRWKIRKWVRKSIESTTNFISKEIKSIIITVRLVEEEEGRLLNKSFRNKDYATNVLTFEYGITENLLTADLVLCLPIIYKEAEEQNKNRFEHAAHIVIHGVLHALGFDHKEHLEALEMESIEISILENLKIKNPYEQ